MRFLRLLLPFVAAIVFVVAWALAAPHSRGHIIPGPWKVVRGLGELTQHGLLLRYAVASLFRVTWGYLLAVAVAVPLGLALGWWRRGAQVLGPIVEVLRPISPLAWIPLAILWFGVGDVAAVFIIFVASALPLVVTTMNAVHHIPSVHLHAGRNFGLGSFALLYRVIYPAVLPRLIVGLRLSLGVAWLVVVAAEMIAVNSGLGFLIIDARNAGNRYDLVIAGMVMIGLIGLALDLGIRRLERIRSLRWGFVQTAGGAATRTSS